MEPLNKKTVIPAILNYDFQSEQLDCVQEIPSAALLIFGTFC